MSAKSQLKQASQLLATTGLAGQAGQATLSNAKLGPGEVQALLVSCTIVDVALTLAGF